MLLTLLSPNVEAPPPVVIEAPRGGGPVLYSRKRLEEAERREIKRREVEREIAETIRKAWRTANGEDREEIAEAVEIPTKPKEADFRAAARKIVADDGGFRVERLATIERLLTEYSARKNAERHAQALAWVDAAIAAAIEAEEDDIEAMLVL
jgi:hypothetical protein